MPLIVEDGTAKADAEAYATAAQFKTYFNNRGVDISSLQDSRIEQLLRLAADYMSSQYRLAWKGTRTKIDQGLDWPRFYVLVTDAPSGYGSYPFSVQPDVVPKEIINASILLAYKAYFAEGNELAPDIERATLKEEVGPIAVGYDPNATPITTYRAISGMLAMYMKGDGNSAMAQLVRC